MSRLFPRRDNLNINFDIIKIGSTRVFNFVRAFNFYRFIYVTSYDRLNSLYFFKFVCLVSLSQLNNLIIIIFINFNTTHSFLRSTNIIKLNFPIKTM